MINCNDVAVLGSIAKTLETQPLASQRTLAENAQMSSGLMNAVIKRFVERGWIMLSNVNKRKLSYALTADGIDELTKRGKKFVERTFEIANSYNQIILDEILKAKQSGKTKVILFGNSYIKFLLEYACKENNVVFEIQPEIRNPVPVIKENEFCIAGELNESGINESLIKAGCIDLLDIIQNKSIVL